MHITIILTNMLSCTHFSQYPIIALDTPCAKCNMTPITYCATHKCVLLIAFGWHANGMPEFTCEADDELDSYANQVVTTLLTA